MKVFINNNHINLLQDLFLVDRLNDGGARFLAIEDGEVVSKYVDAEAYRSADSGIKPLIRLPADEMQQVVKGFVEYARQQDFRFNEESETKGELAGTKRHLADLRELLKLKN